MAERFDAIAVLFLHYALKHGYDLCSEYPISEELYYTLTYHVIPQIYACNKDKSQEIRIHAPVIREKLGGEWVGTGISCGIDSLSVVYEYTRQIELEDYKLTHLMYFSLGQHAEAYGYNPEKEQQHFHDGVENAKGFAEEIGLPIIIGESNFNQLAHEVFDDVSLLPTHTLRNLGSIMILQNHFAKYYYATTFGDMNSFKIKISGDIAYYERWLIPLLSNNSVKFFSASRNLTRVEKTKLLANFPESYNHLSACWRGTRACGYCGKCIRTMTTLDLLGALDKFKNVFDVDMYRKRKPDLFAYMYLNRKKDYFYGEIMQYMEENGLKQTSIWDILRLAAKRFADMRYPQCQAIEWRYCWPLLFAKKCVRKLVRLSKNILRLLIGKRLYEKLKYVIKGRKAEA